MFSYEICKMFKNTNFEEHLRTTASRLLKKIVLGEMIPDFQRCFCLLILHLINNARNTSIFDAIPFHIHLLLKDLMSLLQICCNSFESYKNWKTHLLCCLNQMDRSDLILVCFLLLCIDFKKN